MQSERSRRERIGLIVKHAEASRHSGAPPDADPVIRVGGGEGGESIRIVELPGPDIVGGRMRAATATLEAANTAARKHLAREV